MPFAAHWTEFFFYPILPSSCPICALPTVERAICDDRLRLNLPGRIGSATYLSYTWGRSWSPGYAFKDRKKFDQELREEITKLFGWMAHTQLARLADEGIVVGAPPRRTIKLGMQGHLDDLLCAIEQVNFRVLRNVFAFDNNRLVLADPMAATVIRGRPIVVVDNVVNTRSTVNKLATKPAEGGASEIHLCIMGRWIEGSTETIRAVRDFRTNLSGDPAYVDEWYRSAFQPY